jgi:acetyl esterase
MTLEPQTQSFLDALAAQGAPPLYTLPIDQGRAAVTAAQAGAVAKPPADVEDRTVPTPHGEVLLKIVRPKGSGGTLPVVMFFHGAGWVFGDWNSHVRLALEIATGAGAAVVFVEYTRSPEARYPVAIEQLYAATKWVVENASSLNLNASRLAVAGDSVGGNMAAAVTLLAKERGGPPIALQVLFYPVTDANFDTPSYHRFATGYWLTRPAMQWFWDQYLPDPVARSHPTVAPLRAPDDQLRGLPPALVITAENDVLRDEGEAYARKLTTAGVRVTATRYLGTIHDFVLLNAIAETPATRGAIAQACGALRQALHG